jgi:uncharacterized LabA/DUF88 family protein
MFNRRFMDAVRVRLINILDEEAKQASAKAQQAGAGGYRYHPDDVVAFVDLQNFHYFLKENCRVPAQHVHLPNLLKEFGRHHGLPLRDIRVFTGIHDAEREPQFHEAMAKRLRWLQRFGVKTVALPLSYYEDKVTKQVRSQEKGVDVRIASEILRAVNDGLHRALVITQDKDISQAVKVASEMALERGFKFEAYSPVLEGADWEHNGRCGMWGVAFTTKLPFHVEVARRHVRTDLPRRSDDAQPEAAA